jgi:hypothetical protein
METINNLELRDESIYPDEQVLKTLFGDAYPAYCKLLELYDANQMEYTWRYYHDGNAWLCKVQKKKRTIVWMSAWKGYMQATIYFPEKYIDVIYKLDIPEARKKKIRETKNTGMSKPCIFEIRGPEVLEEFNQVMQFKIGAK